MHTQVDYYNMLLVRDSGMSTKLNKRNPNIVRNRNTEREEELEGGI